jgi:hypothetical protein
MTLLLRKPDGTLSTVTEDQLTIGWNAGEIAGDWQVQRPGESQWRTVAEQLGIEIPSGQVASAETSAPSTGSRSLPFAALRSRYRDAYRMATGAVVIGGTLKIMAVCAGGFVLIMSMLPVSRAIAVTGGADTTALLIGLVAAVLVGVPLYALGILVSAHGQMLKATLDTAVNTSPLLENDQKASIMSL